ncbi:pyridoxamine kinase [Salmonella enterica subsp. enterica]|uniref:Pyridoxamine kinase n=1 Tax=Salmonella enterica I TaxID=59201 RepID=A0A379WV00_SALET|nr:pyridoxamine kinase [Salmonella enterica subsp. enterica]
MQQALEHVTAAVYEIMIATKTMQEYELQVVAAPGTGSLTLNITSAQRGCNYCC